MRKVKIFVLCFKIYYLSCLFQICYCHLIQFSQTLQFYDNQEYSEYIIEEGQDFNLSCDSQNDNTWSSNAVHFKRRRVFSVEEISYLSIHNVTHLNTGYYSCYSNSNEETIYIYVNDKKHLQASDQYYMFITCLESGTLIIPCRPSHPGVSVSLKRQGKETYSPEYKNQIGFIYRNVTSSQHTGLYVCQFSRENITEESYYHITILQSRHQMLPMRPSLEVLLGQKKFFLIDNHLEMEKNEIAILFCNVTLDLGHEARIHWWKNKKRIQQSNVLGLGMKDNKKYIYSTLELNSNDSSIQGSYKCIVTNHIGENNSVTFNLTVVDKSECSISLVKTKTLTQCLPITSRGGNNVTISMVLKSHPKFIPSILWSSSNGSVIYNSNLTQNDSKFKFIPPNSNSIAILELRNVSLLDNGIFTITCSNTSKSSIHVCLQVLEKPKLRMVLPTNIKNDELFLLHHNYSFECQMTGNPLPSSIVWTFCKDVDCNQLFEIQESQTLQNITSLNDRKIVNMTDSYQRAYCSACILEECFTSLPVFLRIVDYSPPKPMVFGICSLIVKHTCESITSFENSTTSLFRYKSESLRIICVSIVDNAIGRVSSEKHVNSVQKVLTKYSERTLWKFDYLQLNDSNTFSCFNKSLSLIIKDIQPPRPKQHSFNMNNTFKYIDFQNLIDPPQILLNCSLSGIPSPVIQWFKNGKSFNIFDTSNILVLSKSSLLLTIHSPKDMGHYECRANNLAGNFKCYLNITIPEKAESNSFEKSPSLKILYLTLILTFVVFLLFSFVVFRGRYYVKTFRYLSISFEIKSFFPQRSKNEMTDKEIKLFITGNPSLLGTGEQTEEEIAHLLPYDQRFEFPRNRLKIGKQIGSGAFGRVMLAEAYGIHKNDLSTQVAVKMCKPPVMESQLLALMSELKIMSRLGTHNNVVNLLGACTTHIDKHELLVIVEYCPYGNLQNILITHRSSFINQIDEKTGIYKIPSEKVEASFRIKKMSVESTDSDYDTLQNATDMTLLSKGDYTAKSQQESLCTKDLLAWSHQIARGMEHLSSKNIIHGDLAARNILLAKDNIVKICDFGLSRSLYLNQIYQKKSSGPLPVKWMAIESINYGYFSSQSDVWSYGIVLWELFALGKTPYPGVEPDHNFQRKLETGYRMSQPEYSPNSIYRIMLNCWDVEPQLRPSFSRILEKLELTLQEGEVDHYLQINNSSYVNSPTQNLRLYKSVSYDEKSHFVIKESPLKVKAPSAFFNPSYKEGLVTLYKS